MSLSTNKVLVVDDNREVLTAIRLLLKEHVAAVHTTRDPDALPALLRDTAYDVILLDMNFTQGASSGQEGFRWLHRILRVDPAAVVIMITAYGDVEKAVRAMKEGATDFVVKPWKNEHLLAVVEAAVKLRRSRQAAEQSSAPTAQARASDAPEMIGESPAMQRVIATLDKVAATDANVLVLGEHGTGKELVARLLHRQSHRADQVFLSVDLGALSESLFESELFGHVKGAFTGADRDRAGRFESASGGTLFLDEIGNVPLALQRKLLTVLERREVIRVGSTTPIPIDIRLICATNQPLYEMARLAGHDKASPAGFREDLLYRINTVEIHLPPLREREADIPLLAEHFLHRYARTYGAMVEGISPAALDKLRAYHWPGNVRELEHTMERAVIMSEQAVLRPSDVVLSATPEQPAEALSLESLDLEEIERTAIRKALSKYGGNISRAAAELGLTRRSLYRRIEKYGL